MNTKQENQNADATHRWVGPWMKHKLVHERADWVCSYIFYVLFSCDSEDNGIVRPAVEHVQQWLLWLNERAITVDVQRAKQYCINYIDC